LGSSGLVSSPILLARGIISRQPCCASHLVTTNGNDSNLGDMITGRRQGEPRHRSEAVERRSGQSTRRPQCAADLPDRRRDQRADGSQSSLRYRRTVYGARRRLARGLHNTRLAGMRDGRNVRRAVGDSSSSRKVVGAFGQAIEESGTFAASICGQRPILAQGGRPFDPD
jgi:hypothetical protein